MLFTTEQKRNGHDVELSINQVYKSESRSRFLRSVGPCCNCSICEIAHSNVNQIVSSKKKRGRPKTEKLTTPEPGTSIKVCAVCYTQIYPGCHHHCRKDRYRKLKVNNLESLIATPTSSQRIAARTADDDCLPVLPSQPAQKEFFTVDDMCLIRKDLDLSTRQTIALAQDLRALKTIDL